MKKLILTVIISLFALGIVVQASDLVIESKTQSYSEQENKLKFDGDVKVSVDDLKIVGNKADVSMDGDQKLDTATFYDKPYAYEVKKNKNSKNKLLPYWRGFKGRIEEKEKGGSSAPRACLKKEKEKKKEKKKIRKNR